MNVDPNRQNAPELDRALLELADVLRDLNNILKKHAGEWSKQSQEDRMQSALRVLCKL